MYPLPMQPYPTRTLDTNETNLLRRFTNTLTAAALHDYDCFVKNCHSNVGEDTRHTWKFIKKREGLTVYRDCAAVDPTLPDDNITMIEENGRISNQDHPLTGQIQALLCVGTIPGTLDDIMYGVIAPTAEDTMLKSSCIRDNVVDCCVLASIASPTPADPWRSLTLKWAVNANPVVMRPLVRPRDFTYVESTGATTNVDGERVGHHIIHSVVIPDTQPIDDHELVRGNMSLYHIYRQKSPSTVEVHVRAFWQLNGQMIPKFQTISCVKATIAIAQIRTCSQMKKLACLRQENRSVDNSDPRCCSLCKKWIGGCCAVDTTCSVCRSVICRQCSRSKVLRHFSSLKREVVTRRQALCRRCQRKSEENTIIQESKPVKRTKGLSSRALSTVSTASLDSRDWSSSDRSRVLSRHFEVATTRADYMTSAHNDR